MTLSFVRNQAFADKISAMWENVNYLKHMDKEGHKSLVELLRKYEHLLARINSTRELQNQSIAHFFGESTSFMGDLSFPNIYDYLPHLLSVSNYHCFTHLFRFIIVCADARKHRSCCQGGISGPKQNQEKAVMAHNRHSYYQTQ